MEPDEKNYGQFTPRGEVRFVRLLPGPIERLWAYLVDGDKRAKWFAGGTTEPRVGGKVELFMRHKNLDPQGQPKPEFAEYHDPGKSSPGRVTRWEPPRVFAFIWGEEPGDSEVTFELTPQGSLVQLVLTHRATGGRDELKNVSGGWHTHLDILQAHLAGQPIPPLWSTADRLHAEYQARLPAK
jgi:uncharacterized protein YndB with AHSA1/START domain